MEIILTFSVTRDKFKRANYQFKNVLLTTKLFDKFQSNVVASLNPYIFKNCT